MPKSLLPFLLLLSLPFISLAQNEDAFFKVPLKASADMPLWAQTMYAEDPNVWEVDFLFEQYRDANPLAKTVHTQNYKHWRRLVQNWVNDEGLIRRPSRQEEEQALRRLQERREALQGARNGQWSSLGPYETYQKETLTPLSNHANVYCMYQSPQNPDILFAGTEGGGVFKSVDHGLNWTLVSKNEGFAKGIQDVKIAPDNDQVVYVSANRRVYKSVDGGSSWEEKFFINADGYQLRIHPDNSSKIFLAANNGLYRSDDAGENWTTIYSTRCWDIQFHPTNTDVLYLLKSNDALIRTEFFKSTDGGLSWELKDAGWYMPADPANASELGGKIGVTPAAPDMIYVGLIGSSKEGDQGWIGVYRSDDVGENWKNPSGQDGGPYPDNYCPASYNSGYHQGWFNFDLEVSDINPAVIWVGTIRLNESADSAKTFIPIGAANSQRLSLIHADIQDLEVNGEEIWVASDGGINFSTDELYSHESRKAGIIASDYWGFGSGWNEDVLVGGKYHNGNGAYYETYGDGNYLHVDGVEESTGYVNPLENRKVYFSRGWTDRTVSPIVPLAIDQPVAYDASLPIVPNESYVESSSSGIYFDPRYSDHLYVGAGSSLWKSTNGGQAFELLHNFGDGGKVFEIAISRANPGVLYCVFQPGGGYWDPCEIYRSEDGGDTWTKVTDVPTNNRWRLEITLNPADPMEIWASANSGNNSNKVYASYDGGETWENRTTPILADERPKDICYQAGTDGIVYLATNTGVFYWDQDQNDWVDYSGDLPYLVYALEMRPFYRDEKLRMATYGRGIWESPLAAPSEPVAQPMTARAETFCSRDTVQFDCYSILPHDGASWEWTFDPEPLFVSSLTTRNPAVVFGQEGAYSVSLTITDAGGQSSSQTIPDMVTVYNECQPDTIPGSALVLQGQVDDYVSMEPMHTPSNTITFSAWIKPEGIQNDFSGLIFARGGNTTVGLNFRADNQLGYHWDNAQWWWESGAFVPEGEWSHVALVVEPEQATIYLNGEPYAHTATHVVEPFDAAIVLGADPNWSARRFKGEMDEVCIWNRALSAEEIRRWRHLTKDRLADPNAPEYDPDLLAYYQFNELIGTRVMDRVGYYHGDLSGTADRLPSSAPVGGGASALLPVDASGTYTFGETGLNLHFPESGTLPQGPVVVTRINLLPNVLPSTNDNLGTYWIVNNYGQNTFYSAAPQMDIHPLEGIPSAEAEATPSTAVLYQRASNAHADSWAANCWADEAISEIGGYFGYPASCMISGEGAQYFVASVSPTIEILADETVSTLEKQTEQIRIFPNPVDGSMPLQLQYTGSEQLQWRIYDAQGKLIEYQTLTASGAISITKKLPTGIYFYAIQGESFIQNGRLLVR